mmetsp:Transcript_23227/g.26919  ORF Transcript_23227/g.26919 Transcript_23227/m.26919 type:complete len:277 (-) Transcript_23227:102-932(-)
MDHNIPRPKFCLEAQLDSTKNQMHGAISKNDLKTAKKLMELYGIEPHEECSVKGYYWTAIHYACHFGAKDVLTYFIKYLYNKYPDDFVDIINIPTKENWTPLMISGIYGKPEMAELLLKAGGQRLSLKDKDSKTASELATYYGWSNIASKIDSQTAGFVKSDTATPLNVEFLNKLCSMPDEGSTTTTSSTGRETTDGEEDIEALDQFYDLLKNGYRLPCLICQMETGWIQYTKCCGQPLHYWCIESKLQNCPNCTASNLELISEVKHPERAFTVEN